MAVIKPLHKSRGFRAFERAEKAVERVLKKVRSVSAKSVDPAKLEVFILRKLRPLIIRALMRSFKISGLRTQTGTTAKAVSRAVFKIKKGKIKIMFPAGLPDTVYRYTASNNYGSVRTGKSSKATFSRTAKTKLKRAVFKGAPKNSKAPVKIGGSTTVIRARRFFFLSASDQKRIREKASALQAEFMKRHLAGAKA